MASTILCNEDYNIILKSKFKNQDVKLQSVEWAPLSKNVEGFLGDHYILKLQIKLKNEEKIETFFIKTKPTKTDVQRNLVSDFYAYEKETFLYNHLFKEFERLGYRTDFAPKSFYCKADTTIVMEDLKIKDFKVITRGEFFEMEHCKMALQALATYHANSMCYEEVKSKELGRPYRVNEDTPELFKEVFYLEGDVDGLAARFIRSAVDCYIQLLPSILESEEWKASFQRRIKEFDASKLFSKPLPSRKTCGHGDLWSNNLLFKYLYGIPVHCCLVDFQLLRYFYPSFDAILVLYENTGREFRDKHMTELLNFYYGVFEKIVHNNGFEAKALLSKEEFLEVVDCLRPVALMQGAATRTASLLPAEIMSEAVNAGGDDFEDIMFSSERGKLVIEGIEKSESFRKIILDDIYELNECV